MLSFSNTTPVLPLQEIIAYETLWANKKTSFKTLSDLFKSHPDALPSDFAKSEDIAKFRDEIKRIVLSMNYNAGLLINGTYNYPTKLRNAKEPVELLYYTGIVEYLNTRGVAIVGTRKPSNEGLAVTNEIATNLVKDDFTVVSGLAMGIDTQAHTSAIAASGRTIAVIGTPLNKVYPKENADLQNKIASEHLLISQVPFYRYANQPYFINKNFFLERNKTMSALTEATIIVEAGETSGSLTQATAAIFQKRKLFIWETCFKNKNIAWPQKFADKGAIKVGSYEQLLNELNK